MARHEHYFCWIVFSIDIFKKVNLTLLAYQYIVGVGPVSSTTYLRHVPKSEAIFMLEGFLSKCPQ